MKAVILHGGNGTRLRPLTYTDVKQLLPIAGRPISEYALLNLVEIGITEINIIVGEVGEKEVRDYYGNGSKWGVNVTYTYQNKPLGIAHAVGLVRDFIGNENFVVLLGDNYFRDGLLELAKSFNENDYDCLIALTEVANPSQFGIAEVKEGKIVSLVEKPKEHISDYALVGVYMFGPEIYSCIESLKPSARGELEITEAIQLMIDRGMKLKHSIINGWWKDTGNPGDLLEANMKLLDKYSEENNEGELVNSTILGRVHIGKYSRIQNSRIIGPAYIGDDVQISNCLIGAYSTIGNCSIISDSYISYSLLLEDCNVNGINLSDSIIGKNTILETRRNEKSSSSFVVGENTKIVLS